MAIVAVVLGHWLVTVIGPDGGRLTGRSALPDLTWAHPLTWLFQVLPLFFLAGGYANAASLASARRRGGSAAGWLIRRGARLLPPTTALVLVLAGGALAARTAGADPSQVRQAVWFAAIPLWFLSVYLAVVALTPLMYALHRRCGTAVPLTLAGAVAVGDLLRLHGEESWGEGSLLFGWLAVHQLGFFWRDGRLPARPGTALPLLLGGLGALLLLVLAGPYPVSMINVPGEQLHNMSPPSLALLALATTQLGAILLVRDRAERWLHRARPWTAVVAVNAVVLTVFLWHTSAAILLTVALYCAGLLPTPAVGSAAWFAWRVPWLVLCTAVLGLLVAVFGRIELRRDRQAGRPADRPAGRLARGLPAALVRPLLGVLTRPRFRLAAAVAGFAATAYGLLDNSLLPRTRPVLFGIPTTALVAYLAGAALLRLLRSTPAPASGSAAADGTSGR